MIDTIVESAAILDGRGAPAFVTDVAIVGDRIALIGDLAEREAHARVDGRGRTLAPGFIDVHSHSDELWLVDPRCAGKVLQGVTTEIAGNCGTSAGPLYGEALARRREELRSYRMEPEWQTLHDFFALVERNGVGLNVASLVGLGTTRRCVRGDGDGRLADDELDAERSLVRAAIEEGALGVSSGLIYTPSRWADLDELVACASVAREAGMPRYVSHLRSEGDALLEAVDEALEVARGADVAVQFSHHKAAGKKNWGKVEASLERIARARARGLVAYADVYPYVASWTDLATLLPEDALLGGRDATLARLADPETAAALALRLNLDHDGTWGDVLVSSVGSERNAELAGMRLDAIARRWRLSPARATIRLLLEEKLDPQAIFFTMNENDVATVLSADFACIGSDASARALDGPSAVGVPHPRTFGCFPRVFGRYVRGRKTLELGEAVRRMTSLPAEIFGLRGRGTIERGAYADLVLFDAETIVDTATYERPYAYPLGIDAVWVNGKLAARNGATTRERAGRVLRGGGAA
jgi:N-acyl-D-amino-acid deacylase